MLALCDCRFWARYWQQGAAADYTYFLWFFENLFTRLYVVLKKSTKNIWWLHWKVFGVVFFLFERGKKTKASFRKSLKCPGREAESESIRAKCCLMRPSFLISELAAGFLCQIFSCLCLYCIAISKIWKLLREFFFFPFYLSQKNNKARLITVLLAYVF